MFYPEESPIEETAVWHQSIKMGIQGSVSSENIILQDRLLHDPISGGKVEKSRDFLGV